MWGVQKSSSTHFSTHWALAGERILPFNIFSNINQIFKVHECVLSYFSNAFRFLIKKAKETRKEERIRLEYKNYSKELIKASIEKQVHDH